MALKMLKIASHKAENPTEVSLRQAFGLLEPKLRPPFASTPPNPQEYFLLIKAILYGVLCETHLAKTHIKHLHAIVTDGYGLFVSSIVHVVNEFYVNLVEPVKCQLIKVTIEMIDVQAVGVHGLLVCLLRQIVGGDFSDGNLWLSDHSRLLSNSKVEALKHLEIEFCIRLLREQFSLCLKIGRDLVRLLQDLVHLPEFRAIWKGLVLNQGEFKTPTFFDISQLYYTVTSSQYTLLRITPEMESQLRFLLSYVKLGSQKRYQAWFARKFLSEPNRETLIIDIVRFICCAHHPPNEIIQSDVIPRWAVIGWLLKSCTRNSVAASVKLALLYDWLFFDESIDNVMNIEPAMLLMVYSVPRYIDVTHTLLEFLFLLVDNYDVNHHDIMVKGVLSSFSVLVKKGVIPSLDVLICCDSLSPILRERLGRFLPGK
ncbi:hypothetical protein ABKV19_004086 [Rosa sericea]